MALEFGKTEAAIALVQLGSQLNAADSVRSFAMNLRPHAKLLSHSVSAAAGWANGILILQAIVDAV